MKPVYFGWISFFVTLSAIGVVGCAQNQAARNLAGHLPAPTQSWEELMENARKTQAAAWEREQAAKARRETSFKFRLFNNTPPAQTANTLSTAEAAAVDALIAAREKEKQEDIAQAEARAKALAEAEARAQTPAPEERERIEAEARAAAEADPRNLAPAAENAASGTPRATETATGAAVGPSPENPYGDDGNAVFSAEKPENAGKTAHATES